MIGVVMVTVWRENDQNYQGQVVALYYISENVYKDNLKLHANISSSKTKNIH